MRTRNFLFISLLIVFVLQISGCALPSLTKETQPTTEQVMANENAYQTLITEVKTTDWSKADPQNWENVLSSIKELESYRDTPMFARYMSYLKYLKENKITNAIGVANNIPEDYTGDLQNEINKLKSEAKDLAKAQDLQYYEELIRKGDYETLRRETVEKVSLDADYSAIYNFLSALDYQKKGIRSAMIISLTHISMPYNGLLSEEITAMVNQNTAEIQHMRTYLSGKTTVGKPKPTIGMTINEVLASSWGPPEVVLEVSGTMTTEGKQEQWEYSSDRVIFLEHGFVKAIQY